MAIGLLILRVVVGGLFIGHGAQKLFAWFDGPGIRGTTQFFDSLGYRRPRAMAQLGGWAEFAGGLFLLLGLLNPFAAAAVVGVMCNAAMAAHAQNGLWNSDGGYEFPLVMGTAAATLAFTGPGAASLDNALGIQWSGFLWGLLGVLLGVFAAGAVLAMRETSPTEASDQERRTEEERQAA